MTIDQQIQERLQAMLDGKCEPQGETQKFLLDRIRVHRNALPDVEKQYQQEVAAAQEKRCQFFGAHNFLIRELSREITQELAGKDK